MAPLVGLFVMASIFQVLFASDIAVLRRAGAASAGSGGARSSPLAARQSWQPVILSVGPTSFVSKRLF
jgi:sigma-E factor negative regulatory protein RseC